MNTQQRRRWGGRNQGRSQSHRLRVATTRVVLAAAVIYVWVRITSLMQLGLQQWGLGFGKKHYQNQNQGSLEIIQNLIIDANNNANNVADDNVGDDNVADDDDVAYDDDKGDIDYNDEIDDEVNDDHDHDHDHVHPIDEFIEKETTEGSSLRILLSNLKTYSQPEAYGDIINDTDTDAEADAEAETARCARYGFKYNNNHPSSSTMHQKRRRIFMGSLIADDSWHVIAPHAAEAYGLYHTAVFIESNTTQTRTPRQTRFDVGSLNYRMLQSGIFGPKTDVYVDFHVDAASHLDEDHIDALSRENLQRSYITKRWADAGMQMDDIGIICDIDEVLTRDFLLALQSCDVPEFRPGQSCHSNIISGQGVRFEVGPDCVFPGGFFSHPQAMIGECIDDIGDGTVHKPAVRNYRKGNGLIGQRNVNVRPPSKGGSGGDDGRDSNMYGLWIPWDFRIAAWAKGNFREVKEDGRLHTAYHFHNFFDTFNMLRHKYKTFGHGDGVTERSLASIERVRIGLQCIREQYQNPTKLDTIEGRKPILYQDRSYRSARMRELMAEVEAEEQRLRI